MTVELSGEYTDAKIMGLDEDEVEENVVDQVQETIDSPAFTEPVRVQPDCHYGAGCVIGFTMPLADVHRIVPYTIGVDIGCGVLSAKLSDPLPDGEDELLAIDDAVRDEIPMGFSKHHGTDYHMGEDFPWDQCAEKLEQFREATGQDIDPYWFDGYDVEYFKDVCERVGYGVTDAINSMGTLGGGNHFIEVGKSSVDGAHWVTIHSGSRGIGGAIGEYWQDEATRRSDIRSIQENAESWMWDYVKFESQIDPEDIRQWVYGGKGESFYDMEQIKEDFEGEAIEETRKALLELVPDDRNESLDYLEGWEAWGYYVDMIFAQTYAEVNRYQMLEGVKRATGRDVVNMVHSIHNFIDFEDTVMRKGACSAHEGESIVIPFNMKDGTIIARGKGNDEWNNSAPHGSGRVMSRTQAFNELDVDEFQAKMDGVASSSVTEDTLDEAPSAYKSGKLIEDAVQDTATIVERLEPILNIKSTD